MAGLFGLLRLALRNGAEDECQLLSFRQTGDWRSTAFIVNNAQTEFPHPGVAVRTNPHGIKLVFLHYSADPDKGDNEKTLVPEIRLALSTWTLAQYRGMTKKEM